MDPAGSAVAGLHHPDRDHVIKQITKRSFCLLSTASSSNRPHVAGVLYAAADNILYVSTLRTSKKARNVAENPRVSVCVPIRRLPVGPPSSVQFEAVAEILALDDPEIARLATSGALKAITGHGELHLPHGCFLRITPARRLNTYGLGMPLRRLLRDPLHAGGRVDLDAPAVAAR